MNPTTANRTAMRRLGAALVLLLTACPALVCLAPPAAAAGFAVRELSLSATAIDVTSAPAAVKIRTRLVRSTRIFNPTVYTKLRDAVGPAEALRQVPSPAAQLTQVSGTDTDGVFEGTLTLISGLQAGYDLSVTVGDLNADTDGWSSAQLRAAGFADRVTTTTSKPPGPLMNVKGRTVVSVTTIVLPWYAVSTEVTYTIGAVAAAPWVELVSATSPCGNAENRRYTFTPQFVKTTLPYREAGLCTIKLRAVNSAGVGPTVSTTFQ